MRRWCGRISVCGLLLFIAGCSEPPTTEHDQAVSAIAAARAAGAEVYAAEDLTAADASLKRYDDFVAQRDYKQALSSALDARDRGFEAARLSAQKKAALQAEADALLQSLGAALVTANAQIKAPHPKSAARQVETLRQTVKAANITMQEAGSLIARGELTTAVRRLGNAIAALKRDSSAFPDGAKKNKKLP